jgi:hypothetical protein
MWGMPARTVKLSEAQVERKYYASLLTYFTRSLTFECNPLGWDRDLLDEGTKVLYGQYVYLDGQPSGPPAPPTGGPPRPADPVMWKLLPLDEHGTTGDPANPTHFVTYLDRLGNPGRVVLNGKGIPAGTVSVSEQRYAAVVANTNVDLGNGGWWCPIPSLLEFPLYDPTRDYRRGELVLDAGGLQWICTGQRVMTAPVATDVLNWVQVTALTDKGNWNSGTAYAVGDYVRSVNQVSPGWIHVERYNESDFVNSLGIPDPV